MIKELCHQQRGFYLAPVWWSNPSHAWSDEGEQLGWPACQHPSRVLDGAQCTRMEKQSRLLQLNMPNSVLTDLVVSFFSFLSYQINLWQPRCPYASLSFHIMPHALLTLFISAQCMAMFFSSFLPFCHRRAVASCSTSFPFHGRAWCTLPPHATRYRNILEQSLVDLVQICTNLCSSI